MRAGWRVSMLVAVLVFASSAVSYGQTLTARWDPNPLTDLIINYQVCIGTTSFSCNYRNATLPLTATSYAFTPNPGVLYLVSVRAVNASGPGPYSPEARISIPSLNQPPNPFSSVNTPISPMSLTAVDPDGGQLQFTQTGLPSGLSLNQATGVITGTPSVPGSYNVTVAVWDGIATSSRSFVWTVIWNASSITLSNSIGQPADFDGDGRTDIWLFERRNGRGTWNVRASGTQSLSNYQWGSDADVTIPGDFDGDGRSDYAVFRPSTGMWYIMQSSSSNLTWFSQQWGTSADRPLSGDFDGDGKTDIAVYRPWNGTWYIRQSNSNNLTSSTQQWGTSVDIPVPGDFDGDGKTDIAVYRPSTGVWYLKRSSTNNLGYVSYQWGAKTDVPVPADYDGDGRTDIAVFRPSNGMWYILKSSTNFTTPVSYQWGWISDIPMIGDYDGDGKSDLAVYRPSTGTWFIKQSSTNYGSWVQYQWGN